MNSIMVEFLIYKIKIVVLIVLLLYYIKWSLREMNCTVLYCVFVISNAIDHFSYGILVCPRPLRAYSYFFHDFSSQFSSIEKLFLFKLSRVESGSGQAWLSVLFYFWDSIYHYARAWLINLIMPLVYSCKSAK